MKKRAVHEKRCAMCKNVKPRAEFHVQTRNYPERGLSGEYLSTYCIVCTRAYYRAKIHEHRLRTPRKTIKPAEIEFCEFEGCTNEARSRYRGKGLWLCMGHWQQRAAGRELAPLTTKKDPRVKEGLMRCISCEKIKPDEAFHLRTSGRTRQTECKACNVITNTFHLRRRTGRLEDALRALEKAPERMRKRLWGKYSHEFNSVDIADLAEEWARNNGEEETQ